MSVINQMLVELERRRASGAERDRIPDHVRALPDDTRVRSLLLTGIAAVLTATALFAVGVWWWMQRPAEPAPSPVAAVVAPPTPPQAETRPEEWIARRLTLDISQVPESRSEVPPPIETAAVVAPRDSVAPVPARAPAPPVQKPADAAPVAALRTLPSKPPVAERPVAERTTAPPVPAATLPPAEIDKQVREQTPRQRAETEYARGTAALHQGQFAEARSAFENALQIDPRHHPARQALVGVLLDGRRQADAMRVLQEGLQLAPSQHGFAMTLARLQLDGGDLDVGVETLARSLEYPGASPDYAAFYAGLLQRQQKHVEAVTQFERALRQRGGVGVWLLGLGVSLEALGRNAEAQEAYRRAKASGNLSAELQAFADQRLR